MARAPEQVVIVVRGVGGPGVCERAVEEDVCAGGDDEIGPIGVVIGGPALAAKIAADRGDSVVLDECLDPECNLCYNSR